ncbi:hypothetical protein A5634_19550 [Mycobacterium asiaticum]|uniref:Uncharacterized protein n=2 Tax=Mycobacterium asiaticum TaxID=1790 RepID=A0A1A3P8D0_MYCAS|nr:hypothetical protein A5634_19550 [Mycobacterium asiaticum]
MMLQKFAWSLLTGIIGLIIAIGAGSGVARADPDDATPPVIDDFATTLYPALSLDPRDRDGRSFEWPGTGNYCQNRFVTCRVGGF